MLRSNLVVVLNLVDGFMGSLLGWGSIYYARVFSGI